MKCCKCEAAIPDNARFCPECGSAQADVESLRERCLKYVGECEKAVKRGEGSRPFIRKKVFDLLAEWKQAAEERRSRRRSTRSSLRQQPADGVEMKSVSASPAHPSSGRDEQVNSVALKGSAGASSRPVSLGMGV